MDSIEMYAEDIFPYNKPHAKQNFFDFFNKGKRCKTLRSACVKINFSEHTKQKIDVKCNFDAICQA